MSENDIRCDKFEESVSLIEFIEKYQNLKQIILINSMFVNNWTDHIAPNMDIEKKLNKLYSDLNDKLKINNRDFIFIDYEWNFINKEFSHLFFFLSKQNNI